jgi:cysteinyl-tRNA synthetase
MEKDKNKAARDAYNEKIALNEQALEDLATQRKKIRDALDNFARVSAKEFSNIQTIDEQLAESGSRRAEQDLADTAAQAKMLRNFLTTEEDNFERTFAQEAKRLEEEREQLQSERDALPFD